MYVRETKTTKKSYNLDISFQQKHLERVGMMISCSKHTQHTKSHTHEWFYCNRGNYRLRKLKIYNIFVFNVSVFFVCESFLWFQLEPIKVLSKNYICISFTQRIYKIPYFDINKNIFLFFSFRFVLVFRLQFISKEKCI